MYGEAENTTEQTETKPKPKRIRKPNMRALIKRNIKRMERISIIAGEAVEDLQKMDDSIGVVEDLKKKLKDM